MKQRLISLADCTPLRLVWEERELLRLLESTLYISDYTDNTDIFHAGNKNRVIVKQIRQICSILTGLVLARDYEEGQRMIREREFAHLAPFFQACFEIGRRHKILNPDRMRDSYGKLIYFLMDSQTHAISDLLGFDCVKPVKTVKQLLAKKTGGLDLLSDPLLIIATQEIYAEGLTRSQLNFLSKRKSEAAQQLIRKYVAGSVEKGGERGRDGRRGGSLFRHLRHSLWSIGSGDGGDKEKEKDPLGAPRAKEWEETTLTEEDVEMAVYSMKDHMTFLRYNEKPIEDMYNFLVTHFDPRGAEGAGLELEIVAGRGGARLTHGHARQFQYVKQSLLFWREALRNFYSLWIAADKDMLSHAYRLRETGQGLNRIQQAPETAALMHKILAKVQREAGGWIGSSAIHLGDHAVPNALMFIDKYAQIPLIVSPIVSVINRVDSLCDESPPIRTMILASYGSTLNLKKSILADFFRHAFDGSGADNFFDAGSCIDGRLTSAWNWCNNIAKKPFYHIFLLAGFTSFDGKL